MVGKRNCGSVAGMESPLFRCVSVTGVIALNVIDKEKQSQIFE